jgi:membrane protein YdbS with pleckstrin-like domain
MNTHTHNPVENLGLLVAVACVLAGAFLLHDGTSTPYSSQFEVIGGAALLSVGLVVALLITKSRWQRTVWRYRRHLH